MNRRLHRLEARTRTDAGGDFVAAWIAARSAGMMIDYFTLQPITRQEFDKRFTLQAGRLADVATMPEMDESINV